MYGKDGTMAEIHIMSCGCMEISGIKEENNDQTMNDYRYCVQLGTFRTYEKAMEFQGGLMNTGMMSDIEKQGDLYSVYTGDYENVDEAALLERFLRFIGYNTLVIAVEQKENENA
jgi:cell division protein FtsN